VRVTAAVALVLLSTPGIAGAQDRFVSLDGTWVAASTDHFGTFCGRSNRGAFGVAAGRNVFGAYTSLVGTARLHFIGPNSACDIDFFLQTGTHTVTRTPNLLIDKYVTIDARLRAISGLTAHAFEFELGLGMAWRDGRDFPYGVVGLNIPLGARPEMRLALTLDYKRFLLTSDRYRYTFDGVNETYSEESLDPIREWAGTLSVGVNFEFGRSGRREEPPAHAR
jgi:hypothetical protein